MGEDAAPAKPDTNADWWYIRDVAAYLGVAEHTITVYRNRTKHGKPGGMPPEDELIVRTPRWRPATIITWNSRRPGMGVGGGRPRKDRSSKDEADDA